MLSALCIFWGFAGLSFSLALTSQQRPLFFQLCQAFLLVLCPLLEDVLEHGSADLEGDRRV